MIIDSSTASDSVLFEEMPFFHQPHFRLGKAVLNRPLQKNALNTDMVNRLFDRLSIWQNDPTIVAIWLEGEGQSFCAGGDVKAAVQEPTLASAFFCAEYRLDALIHHYSKPVIVWGQGFIFGGGLGLWMGADYRIACESALFAMPESLIGFYPDVGAMHFLHKLPDDFGLFWALTATSINAVDALSLGVADYIIASEHQVAILTGLLQLPLNVHEDDSVHSMNDCIHLYLSAMQRNPSEFRAPFQWYEVAPLLAPLLRCSSLSQVEKGLFTFENLPSAEKEGLWMRYKKASPFSLHTIFWLWQKTRDFELDAVFALDVKLAKFFVCHQPDFIEGVRALLIDKDKNPKWHFSSENAQGSGQWKQLKAVIE